MKFIAVPTLVMSSLLVGAVGGAAMTIALQTAGYMRVEENESGMMTVQFDANKFPKADKPGPTEEPPAAS
jgi:hypothetical protein